MLNLIINALPRGAISNHLLQTMDHLAYGDNPVAACEQLLRNDGNIDWNVYLHRYPDVAQAGIDPISHFINHGIFEGRKLHTYFNKEQISFDGSPKISIIIPCYNAGSTIGIALESLLNQTFEDLEIIVVDNGSSDGSRTILERYVKQDARIKVFLSDRNLGQHMARKIGVEKSTSRYVMFLDADDTLLKDACARAFDAISLGYDTVAFQVEVIGSQSLSERQLEEYGKYINRSQPGEVRGEEILNYAFGRSTLSDLLWNKIYDGGLCRHAFGLMENACIISQEDRYEFFVLADHARSALVIPDILYSYHISGNREKRILDITSTFKTYTGTWPVLNRYLTISNNGYFRESLLNAFLSEKISSWLKLSREEDLRAWYKLIAGEYGVHTVISHLASRFSHSWSEIARKFKKVRRSTRLNHVCKHIGLVYTNLGNGTLEPHLIEEMETLLQGGYQVSLILEAPSIHTKTLPDEVQVLYCPLPTYASEWLPAHLEAFSTALKQKHIDTVIFNAPWDMAVLWQLMVCNYMDITTVIYNHENFYSRISHSDQDYSLKMQNKVFRCADKVWCVDQLSELYYRTIGIDAEYLPYPLLHKNLSCPIHQNHQPTITVFGFIGSDSYRHWEAIRTIWMILLKAPHTKAIFYGRFVSEAAREAFETTLHQLGISESIEVLYPEGDLRNILARTDIILSCSDLHSFSHEILEGMAMGIPCLMFRHPCILAGDCDGIYHVEPGDKRALAERALELINNEREWLRMSREASEYAARMIEESSNRNILHFLRDVYISSTLAAYPDEIYANLANILLPHAHH